MGVNIQSLQGRSGASPGGRGDLPGGKLDVPVTFSSVSPSTSFCRFISCFAVAPVSQAKRDATGTGGS